MSEKEQARKALKKITDKTDEDLEQIHRELQMNKLKYKDKLVAR